MPRAGEDERRLRHREFIFAFSKRTAFYLNTKNILYQGIDD